MAAIEYPCHRPYFKNTNTIYPHKSSSKYKVTLKISTRSKKLVGFLLQNPTKTPASKSINRFAADMDTDCRSKMGSGFVSKSDNELMLAIRAGSDHTNLHMMEMKCSGRFCPAQDQEGAFVNVYSDLTQSNVCGKEFNSSS